jgi:ankyrin repeat protein
MDSRDHRGLTPLNCCAIKGDLNFTRLLVERGGANIEAASPKGCTPLLYAGRGGFPVLVKYFISQGANTMRQDNAGGTVVHHAIEKGKEEVMQILIENRVNINIADNAGRTPLFEAVDNN